MRNQFLFIVLLIVLCLPLFVLANTGRITGTVKDSETGDPLPGANVLIQGTALGSATDIKGNFRVERVPVGRYSLIISFMGYRNDTLNVAVQLGETAKVEATLTYRVIEGESVVVTALLQGQVEAINKQLSSNTIVNVVSKDKIEELPDQNAAESLSRMPGISVQRDAGEAQKVVVRGLAPKFNAITVNGERIPATDSEDRSVDLSMVSSDILEGIEVFKSLTPDKDGDAVGGTINFIIKKARPGFRGNTRIQYGYNDHETDFGQYKGSFSASNRYFKDKLGIVATGNLQEANRSSDLLNAGYLFSREQREGEERALIQVSGLNLGDRLETRNRYGASLTFDYDLGEESALLLSSFWGLTERDELRRRKRYRVEQARVEYELRDREINTRLLTNSLSGSHNFGSFQIDWRSSYSETKQDMPFSHNVEFRELAAFRADLIDDQGPEFIPLGAKNNLDETFFKESAFDESDVKDRDLTAQIDLKMHYNLGTNLVGYLKLGGKIRDKNRDRDNSRVWTSFFGINDLGDELADGTYDLTDERNIAISNFIDTGASIDDFLEGQYDFGPVLNRDLINNFGQTFRDYTFQDGDALYVPDPIFDLDDYEAEEQVKAAYIMSELNLSKYLMLLGGGRFERTENNYRSIFGDPSVNEDGGLVGSFTDTTGGQSYSEFLPMFHLRIKPTSWFDIRFAVTKSLSRPDYFNLVPWQNINRSEFFIEQGNPNLEHTKVWNYDAYLSLYNNLGLFTIGAFYKNVRDIDYISVIRLSEGQYSGYQLTQPVNAEGTSKVKGLEFEIQTNLSLLPSPFDGVVLDANLSLISSETFFPFFEIGPRSPDPPFRPTIIDTVRKGRLPGQADYIANLSVGYEKGGFTGRLSMVAQGEILETIGTRSELDGFSDSFIRWDLAVQQDIWRKFSVFLNVNNLTNQAESEFLGIRAFPLRDEFFGWTGDLGVRYKF